MTARLAAALATVVLTACEVGSAGSAPPSPTPSAPPPSAPPPASLRAPAAAVLDDAVVGLPRLAARDHLSATEAARDQPDEQAALEVFSGWGWIEASTRSWGSGQRRIDATVLLSLRAQGARRAYEFWASEADRPPLVGGTCPAGVAGLDECRYGSGGGRSVVVGRLDAAVFRVAGAGVDVLPLAQVQAARLLS